MHENFLEKQNRWDVCVCMHNILCVCVCVFMCFIHIRICICIILGRGRFVLKKWFVWLWMLGSLEYSWPEARNPKKMWCYCLNPKAAWPSLRSPYPGEVCTFLLKLPSNWIRPTYLVMDNLLCSESIDLTPSKNYLYRNIWNNVCSHI